MRIRDTLERLFWTFVASFLSTLLGAPVLVDLVQALNATPVVLDIAPIGYAVISAAVAGATAVANYLLIIARWRLDVLPSPGQGLPALGVREVEPSPPPSNVTRLAPAPDDASPVATPDASP